MNITLEKTKALIGRFAVVFPLHTDAGIDDLAEVWHAGLADIEDADVMAASKQLLRTLTRFPYPADIVSVVHSAQEPPNVRYTP